MDELIKVIDHRQNRNETWSEWSLLVGAERDTCPESITASDFAWFEWETFDIDPNKTWRENYEDYLQSPRWQRIRGVALYLSRNRCARCGWAAQVAGRGLEVHHKTYKHLGDEPQEDLEVLCPACHQIADIERAAKNKTGGVGR